MSPTKSTVLVKHHLKSLKLPTMSNECAKVDKPHGVQIPPPSLLGVIGWPAGSSAFREANATATMSEPNLDPPPIDLKAHVLHLPGFIDSEEAS